MSNVGDFSWSWIVKDFISRLKKRKENWSSHVHFLQKTSHEKVSRRSRAVIVKEMYRIDWCTCRAVILLKITIFLTLSLSCRGGGCLSSLLLVADPGGAGPGAAGGGGGGGAPPPPPPPAIWRTGSTTHYCIKSSCSGSKLENVLFYNTRLFLKTIVHKTNVNV